VVNELMKSTEINYTLISDSDSGNDIKTSNADLANKKTSKIEGVYKSLGYRIKPFTVLTSEQFTSLNSSMGLMLYQMDEINKNQNDQYKKFIADIFEKELKAIS